MKEFKCKVEVFINNETYIFYCYYLGDINGSTLQ